MNKPRSLPKRESTRVSKSREKWSNVKSDFLRFYDQEDRPLEESMSMVREIHGINPSRSSWTKKLREWGCRKHLTEFEMHWIVTRKKQRLQKGKETVFFHRETEITKERFKNFRKRASFQVVPDMGTPEGITYQTPSPSSEVLAPDAIKTPSSWFQQSSELTGDLWEELRYSFPLSEGLKSSLFHATSTSLVDTSTESSEYPMTATEEPSSVMSDLYLLSGDDPWTPLKLSHHLVDHDIILAKQRRTHARLNELFGLLNEGASPLVAIGVNDQSGLNCYSATDHPLDGTIDIAAEEDFIEHAVALAKLQSQAGPYSPSALRQEFELAKAAGRVGHFEEAEYHCRRILDIHPQVDVQTSLGMMLATVSRLEEATFLLFSALAGFIIEFPDSTITENEWLLESINSLFLELILRTDRDWTSIQLSLRQMVTTISHAISNETTDRIYPQLLLQGFSLAYQSSILSLNGSAKHMYKVLLEKAEVHLSSVAHGNEKGEAHRSYGALLSKENDWNSGAVQLIAACENAMQAETHDRHLTSRLKRDFSDLDQHLEPEMRYYLSESIGNLLIRNQRQPSPLTHLLGPFDRSSRVENYFRSDLPFHLTRQQASVPVYTIEAGPPFTTVQLQGEEHHSSSGKMSSKESHKLGSTFSNSIATGVSESGLIESFGYHIP